MQMTSPRRRVSALRIPSRHRETDRSPSSSGRYYRASSAVKGRFALTFKRVAQEQRGDPLSPPRRVIDRPRRRRRSNPSSGCATRGRSSRARRIPARPARSARKSRILCRYALDSTCRGCSGSGCSSITLMNEQPSNSGVRNQASNTSKMASNCSRGSALRCSTSPWSHLRVHTSSRRSKNANTRSCLEAKWRYIVCRATPDRSMIASIPTAWMPRRENSS